MSNISMIACVGKNLELGKDNKLIWHIPADMKFFKETTTGHKVIMGRKTYESLPGKLKDREMIVISRNDLDIDCMVVHSIDELIDKYNDSSEEVFVIGGARVYQEFLKYAQTLYLTEVSQECSDADAYFPIFNIVDWDKSVIDSGEYKNVKYDICKYKKKVMKR